MRGTRTLARLEFMSLTIRPLVVSWIELHLAMLALHQDEKADVDRLHDIWKQGAPSPDSIIRDPRHYDERLPQAGNDVRRLVLPTPLVKWIMDVSARRGYPYSAAQAAALIEGEVRYI